jgi:hypothetical protein
VLELLLIVGKWLFGRVVERKLREARSRQHPLITATGTLALTLLG